MFGILEGATIPFVGSISEISHLGRAGPFTIEIRDHDSKSHFLMSRELPIQFSVDSTHFLMQPIMFSRNLAC